MTQYLRDIVADMPQFRDREPPLPMRPRARCSKATAGALPPAPSMLVERGISLR